MRITEIISIDHIACGVETASKKRALELASELMCTNMPSLNQNEIFESLIAREKLGSTGLGKGVAIPHGRLKTGDNTIAAFLQLRNGVDYDAPDGELVDLLCVLMVPAESTDEHLQVLALFSEMFRQDNLRQSLRDSREPEQIYAILTQSP